MRSNYICRYCGKEICIGEDYYNFYSKVVCNDCLYDYTAEFRKAADLTDEELELWVDPDDNSFYS